MTQFTPNGGPMLRPTRRLPLLGASALVVAACFLSLTVAAANAATLTNVSWLVSNNQVGATGVSYGYSFKTATAGTIGKITFTVSGANLAGAPAISRVYGVGAGTVARVGQTVTYTVTTPVSIAAGIPIYVELSGMTNGSPAGTYTTTVTTQTAAAATIDTATSPAVTLAANNTAATVSVDKSLTLTVDTTAFELDMDPSLAALADQTAVVNLTV